MFVFLITVFIVIFLGYKFSTWTFDHWDKLGVSYVKPTPLFGNLDPINPKSMITVMKNYYFEFPGKDYFGMWFFRNPVLVIRSPELAKRILIKDFDNFTDRGADTHSGDSHGKFNIFIARDPLWSSIRKALTPTFSTSKLKSYFPIIEECSRNLVEKIRTDSIKNGKDLDLYDLHGCYHTDIISAASFGITGDALTNPDSVIRSIVLRMTTMTWKRRIHLMTVLYAPALKNIVRPYVFTKESSKYFTELYREAASQRKQLKNNQNKRHEILLDILADLKENVENVNDIELTEEIIVAQGIAFLFAGTETTGTAGTFALLELANAPDVQQKLYEEIMAVKKNNNGEIPYEAIFEMKYLDMVCKETLRKYVALSDLDRQAKNDYKIDDSLTNKKGQSVKIDVIGMQMDPKYFPEPEKFLPERFAPGTEDNWKNVYLPFGTGPRGCIGNRFANLSLRAGICKILSNFVLRPHPNVPTPNNITLLPISLVPRADCDTFVKFIERPQ